MDALAAKATKRKPFAGSRDLYVDRVLTEKFLKYQLET